ncbi:hypothetical protein LJB42_003634 [Komagataella kurtzmanii]|nr:hypothetical protein LJB42_003634 [Komagataella kurtzmanii]
MKKFLLKFITKKFFGETKLNRFGFDDPYYEEVQLDPTDPNSKVIRSYIEPPVGLSDNDTKLFQKIQRRSYRLDYLFNICGVKFGWNGVISVVPVVGDVLAAINSLLIYRLIFQLDNPVPWDIHFFILLNIIADFLFKLIPIVGSFVDIGFKANSRNAALIEKHLATVAKANQFFSDVDSESASTKSLVSWQTSSVTGIPDIVGSLRSRIFGRGAKVEEKPIESIDLGVSSKSVLNKPRPRVNSTGGISTARAVDSPQKTMLK